MPHESRGEVTKGIEFEGGQSMVAVGDNTAACAKNIFCT